MTDPKQVQEWVVESLQLLEDRRNLLIFIKDLHECLNNSILPSRGYEIDLDTFSFNNAVGIIDLWKNNLVKAKLQVSKEGIQIQKDYRVAGFIDYKNNVDTCNDIIVWAEEYCK